MNSCKQEQETIWSDIQLMHLKQYTINKSKLSHEMNGVFTVLLKIGVETSKAIYH